MKIKYFKSASDFRQWLEAHHTSVGELWVGFFKKDSGKGGLTYADAVDAALCFGWIDGLKKRVNQLSYTHRFTPRRLGSNWSLANIRRVKKLKRLGRIAAAGLQAFAARDPRKCGRYSFENDPRKLAAAGEKIFKADQAAWHFFQQQPPGYQRIAIWWVVSAKKEETRGRRLAQLIQASHDGQRLRQLTGVKKQ